MRRSRPRPVRVASATGENGPVEKRVVLRRVEDEGAIPRLERGPSVVELDPGEAERGESPGRGRVGSERRRSGPSHEPLPSKTFSRPRAFSMSAR
jgi:hypothetical protein